MSPRLFFAFAFLFYVPVCGGLKERHHLEPLWWSIASLAAYGITEQFLDLRWLWKANGIGSAEVPDLGIDYQSGFKHADLAHSKGSAIL
jgi:hypothetical protein